MSGWTKCSDELPPIGERVLVAWDGSNMHLGTETYPAAVLREVCCEGGFDDWEWYESDGLYPCDWTDDEYPTHWMPWPEFKP